MRGQRPKTILEELRQTGHPLDRTEFSTGFASDGLDRTEGTEREGGREGTGRESEGMQNRELLPIPQTRPSSGPGPTHADLHRHICGACYPIIRHCPEMGIMCLLQRGDDAQELESSTGDFRPGAPCAF